MGSDNLLQISRWRNWKEIFHLVPVAVVERPGSALLARGAEAALCFARHRSAANDGFAKSPPPTWTMIEAHRNPMSATRLRAEAAVRHRQPVG
jgi:nicotinate-nucleotide adenylyltransferase